MAMPLLAFLGHCLDYHLRSSGIKALKVQFFPGKWPDVDELEILIFFRNWRSLNKRSTLHLFFSPEKGTLRWAFKPAIHQSGHPIENSLLTPAGPAPKQPSRPSTPALMHLRTSTGPAPQHIHTSALHMAQNHRIYNSMRLVKDS